MRLQLDDLPTGTTLADPQAAACRRFVVVSATIENLGQAAEPYDGGEAQLVAGDGTVYRPLSGEPNAPTGGGWRLVGRSRAGSSSASSGAET